MKPRPDRHCPHCRSSAERKHCAKCNRRMCADCISIGELGDECGLCVDREQGYRRWEKLKAENKTILDFDEWYDRNA